MRYFMSACLLCTLASFYCAYTEDIYMQVFYALGALIWLGFVILVKMEKIEDKIDSKNNKESDLTKTP